ncbi:WSSV381 [White spot syndrome virus]|uniref:WSSV381 n=1 Tax=White spot syndrome virus TaxID=342409 RepID=A0A2I6SC80_9VIRU|nr:WSSV381 [White spot syndrome virus]
MSDTGQMEENRPATQKRRPGDEEEEETGSSNVPYYANFGDDATYSMYTGEGKRGKFVLEPPRERSVQRVQNHLKKRRKGNNVLMFGHGDLVKSLNRKCYKIDRERSEKLGKIWQKRIARTAKEIYSKGSTNNDKK